MPSGAKKRKAAAKKNQVNDPPSSSSSSANPHQGENENDNKACDPLIEVEKIEEDLSENKVEDEGSKSKSSTSSSSDSSDDESRVVEKKVVVVESVPVVEPETVSPVVDDPVKGGNLLVEEVSHVYEEKKDLVVEEVVAPEVVEEETLDVSEIDLKVECPTSSEVVEPVLKESEADEVVEPVLKESEGEKLPLSDVKAYFVAKGDVASSTATKDSISEVNGADRANETDTVENSDRQALVASTPLSAQKTTSWTSCCGIFDLFSGSRR